MRRAYKQNHRQNEMAGMWNNLWASQAFSDIFLVDAILYLDLGGHNSF